MEILCFTNCYVSDASLGSIFPIFNVMQLYLGWAMPQILFGISKSVEREDTLLDIIREAE